MLRGFGRSLLRLLTAIVLLALLLCALEVGLRLWTIRGILQSGHVALEHLRFVSPSPCCWIDVIPHLDLKYQSHAHGGNPNSSERAIGIRTTEFGTRGTSPLLPRPAETFRILVLGGEVTFGSELSEQETLTGRLLARHASANSSRLEFINAGCPGAGPLVNFLRYRHHLSVLQPQLVIYVLTTDDLRNDYSVRGALRLDDNKLPAFAPHPRFTNTGDLHIDGICDHFLMAQWFWGRLQETSDLRASSPARSDFPEDTEQLKRRLAPLVVLARLVESQGGRLLVSQAPTAWDLSATSTIRSDHGSTAIRSILATIDPLGAILVHDAIDRFQSLPDKETLFLKSSGQLSAKGIDAYSHLLSETLDSLGGATPNQAARGLPPGVPNQSGLPPPTSLTR